MAEPGGEAPRRLRFHQVDVFAPRAPGGGPALRGNPLAVVVRADDLAPARMAAFADWTNLSETTFLLRPGHDGADYRVRIFTRGAELPFAGHPTLGTCQVWLDEGGVPRGRDVIQECAAGLIRIRRDGGRLAFAAPPLRRQGALAAGLLERVARGLGLAPGAIRAAAWVDNGPGWLAVLLGSRKEVLALRPDHAALTGLRVGVAGPWDPVRDGEEAQFEVRAFIAGFEDPVTGSLNAGLAQWLIGEGRAPDHYVASQGAALGRDGRVHVAREGDAIWIGGVVTPCITGEVTL